MKDDLSHLDAIRISASGTELWIDYSDSREPYVSDRIRWVAGLDGQRTLIKIAANGRETSDVIADVPGHVVAEAKSWLHSTAANAQSQRREDVADLLARFSSALEKGSPDAHIEKTL